MDFFFPCAYLLYFQKNNVKPAVIRAPECKRMFALSWQALGCCPRFLDCGGSKPFCMRSLRGRRVLASEDSAWPGISANQSSRQTGHFSDHVQPHPLRRERAFPLSGQRASHFKISLKEKKRKKTSNPEPVFIEGWSESLSHRSPHQHSSASILEGCKGLITLVGI